MRFDEDHMTEKYMMALYIKRLTIYEITNKEERNEETGLLDKRFYNDNGGMRRLFLLIQS